MAEKVVWEYGKPKESPKKAPLDTPIIDYYVDEKIACLIVLKFNLLFYYITLLHLL